MSITNVNNGMITKIWGPPLWISLHCITFGYPIEPTLEQKMNYKIFLEKVGDVLPCRFCRESYKKFITEEDTLLNDDSLKNRATLTKWLYDLHNKVNNKLGVNYGVDYQSVVDKYEKYRAKCGHDKLGCITPLNEQRLCYVESTKKDCPLIEYNIGKLFKQYADLRKIDKKNYYFWNKIAQNNGVIVRNKIWDNRNEYCDALITHMRKNNIKSCEETGQYQGLPTIHELRLMLCLCTTLSKDDINKCITLLFRNNIIY